MKVLITGATGLIGREVGKVLANHGHQIFVISRDRSKALENLPFPCEVITGDLVKGPLRDERLKTIEGVINLMGESIIGDRWTEEKKEKIYSSRILGTRHLVQSLPNSLQVFVSGSAIGYYGDGADQLVNEDHSAGSDYLAEICRQWEAEVTKSHGRKAIIRTGLVMAQQGGALDQMLFPFRAGVGGILGDGRQWMSWIHIDDIVGLFVYALENSQVQGPLNGCAPNPVRNEEFSRTLVRVLGKKLGPRIPKLALKAIFGEAAQALTSSLKGDAARAQKLGYKFLYENLDVALEEICKPFSSGEELFYAEQFLPQPPSEVFKFFQDAHNLEQITPSTLNFKVKSISTAELKQGTLIDYDLKIHGVPTRWRTEIDEWQPPHKFVDNQLKGPYRLWRHTHEFKEFCGGTLMIDRIRYRLPCGYLGWLAAAKFVRKDVENIFAFRRKYVATLFHK